MAWYDGLQRFFREASPRDIPTRSPLILDVLDSPSPEEVEKVKIFKENLEVGMLIRIPSDENIDHHYDMMVIKAEGSDGGRLYLLDLYDATIHSIDILDKQDIEGRNATVAVLDHFKKYFNMCFKNENLPSFTFGRMPKLPVEQPVKEKEIKQEEELIDLIRE